MRFLVKVNIPVEAGNQAARAGKLGASIQSILADLKPEAVYFHRRQWPTDSVYFPRNHWVTERAYKFVHGNQHHPRATSDTVAAVRLSATRFSDYYAARGTFTSGGMLGF